MFRMLQTLEREPQPDMNQVYDASPGGERMTTMTRMTVPGHHPGSGGHVGTSGPGAFNENGERIGSSTSNPYKRDNPHKYLLYRPTFSQLFVFLSSGFKELPANGVLLLYLSSDGVFANIKHPEDCKLIVTQTHQQQQLNLLTLHQLINGIISLSEGNTVHACTMVHDRMTMFGT